MWIYRYGAMQRNCLQKWFHALRQNRQPEIHRYLKESSWVERCQEWKAKYPVVQKKHYEDTKHTNVYAFIKRIKQPSVRRTGDGCRNGSACVVGSHAYVIKKGQRFIINSAIASMGYAPLGNIGAVVAEHGNLALNREALKHDDIKDVILVTGDAVSR